MNSKVYRQFFGSLREICGGILFEKVKEEASKAGGSWVAPPLMRVFPAHIQAKKNELKIDLSKKYKTVPQEKIEDILTTSPAVLRDMIDTTGLIGKLADRFRTDATASTSVDLTRTFRRVPQTMVDLGKILQAKELLDRHTKEFEKQVFWERTRADIQKGSIAILTGTFTVAKNILLGTLGVLYGITKGLFGIGWKGVKGVTREVGRTVVKPALGGPDVWKKKDKDKGHS